MYAKIKLSQQQFLIELMKQELAERSVTGQKRRIKAAKFPSLKTLDALESEKWALLMYLVSLSFEVQSRP